MIIKDPALLNEYNEFVQNHERSHLFQSPFWGKIKSAWKNEYILVRGEDGKIKAAASILIRKLPFLPFSFIYAPRGPVCDLHDTDALQKLTEGIKAAAIRCRAVCFKTDTDTRISDTAYIKTMKALGYRLNSSYYNFEGIQARFLMRINLEGKTPDQLLQECCPGTRRNIRLAMRKGVRIVPAKREDIPLFYGLMQATARRDGFVARNIDYFYRLYDSLSEHIYFTLAYVGDECTAGAMIGLYGNKSLYLYGASGNRYRNYMSAYLLIWDMILHSRECGCTICDLRGVPGHTEDKESPLYGLYRFKKGFGGELWELAGEFDLVFKPFWYALFKHAEKLQKTLRKQKSKIQKYLRTHAGCNSNTEPTSRENRTDTGTQSGTADRSDIDFSEKAI